MLLLRLESLPARFCCFARRPAICPRYKFGRPGAPGRFRKRSARPTRIARGRRTVRIAGSLPLVARTATPPASSNGSETISKCSPYILMCMDAEKPRSFILTQLSESICTYVPPFSFDLVRGTAWFASRVTGLIPPGSVATRLLFFRQRSAPALAPQTGSGSESSLF